MTTVNILGIDISTFAISMLTIEANFLSNCRDVNLLMQMLTIREEVENVLYSFRDAIKILSRVFKGSPSQYQKYLDIENQSSIDFGIPVEDQVVFDIELDVLKNKAFTFYFSDPFAYGSLDAILSQADIDFLTTNNILLGET